MRYLELKIQASEQGVEQITALLLGMGITEMSIDDPHDMDDILQKKHEYGWDYIEDDLKENLDREPVISLYFDEADPKAQQMAVMVKGGISALQRRQQAGEFGQQADLGSLTVTENIVDDGDWKDKWKEFFKPTKVTDRIVVKPTWEEYTPKEDELVIEIDPGMAFGTGTHETTSLCMKLMEKYLGEHPEEKRILDVGCGSGILSICGALLGSREILGIEIDEDAVRVAHENVEENHVEDAVKVIGRAVDSHDLKELGLVHGVYFIDNEHCRCAGLAQTLDKRLLLRADRPDGLDKKEHAVNIRNALTDDVHHIVAKPCARLVKARSVHEHKLSFAALYNGGDPVSGGLRLIGNDGDLLADKGIGKGGFTDVRPAAYGYHR